MCRHFYTLQITADRKTLAKVGQPYGFVFIYTTAISEIRYSVSD